MSMSRNTLRALAAVSAVLTAAGTAPAALPCDADLDGDDQVGVPDFLELLAIWGTDPGGPPDFDGDGQVGVTDLLDLLANWGPVPFDFGPGFPDAEAEQIALEMLGAGGPLLPTQEDLARIDFDLNAIRHAESSLSDQPHSPAWIPNELLVSLLPEEPEDEYLCLNEVYQVTDIEVISPSLNLYLLTFADSINVEALAQIYAQAPEVDYAEPNGLFGGQNTWTPTPMGGGVWQWAVDDAWCDCFDGCDCHRVWIFETDADGNVEQISVEETGFPWCDFQNDTC